MSILTDIFGGTPEAKEMGDYFSDLGTPSTEQLSYQLQQLVSQGQITPEEAQAYLVERSNLEGVQQDPATRKAQMDALASLEDITANKGLTASDKAKLAQIATQEQTQARGAREAILQQADARGAGGSGMSILAQLQNQQQAATRASQKGMDVAAQSQERALQALIQQGQLAGQIGQQQFSQDAQKAQEMDAIAKFNAQNKQNVNLANVAAKNQAQATNVSAAQNLANQNVALRNQQAAQRGQVAQQQYENELKRRQGQAGIASTNVSSVNAANQAAAARENQLLGTIIGAGATYAASDENLKKDVEEFNASDFLDAISGKKYKYKDDKWGKGTFAGPMAQDLEQAGPVGESMVKDTPEGKIVNTDRAALTALASLADINERLKKIEGK